MFVFFQCVCVSICDCAIICNLKNVAICHIALGLPDDWQMFVMSQTADHMRTVGP